MNKLLWILLAFALTFGEESPCQKDFTEGVQAYQLRNYKEALSAWEGCSIESASLQYHLGNAYYQLDRWGPAILSYEKALRLDPNHERARLNLKLAEGQKMDTQEIAKSEVQVLGKLLEVCIFPNTLVEIKPSKTFEDGLQTTIGDKMGFGKSQRFKK